MGDEQATTTPTATTPSGLTIGYALFGGILAWMAHLVAQAALVGHACRTDSLSTIHLVTAATVAVTLHALWVGWRLTRPRTSSPGAQAARLLGWIAIFLNVSSVAVILAEWVPVLFLDACVGS